MSVTPLRVALLGLGTVGGAVAARLVDDGWRRQVAGRGQTPPQLVGVGIREPARRRGVDLPEEVARTDQFAALVDRDDVDIVIELLGGMELAGTLVRRALDRGKAVVTANKALLAELGPSLEAAARRSGAPLRFEAAVAGGIPVLAPLARDLCANRITSVRGIVNGTTNHILSAMRADAADYHVVLADAQQRGYAEADPAGDVEGRDAVHKLVLLARVAFGTWLQPSAVRRTPRTIAGDGRAGITGVTVEQVTAAAERGFAIKLIASASGVTTETGTRLVGSVEPVLVERGSVLGSTDGVTNTIEVIGEPVGRLVLQGPGAGGDATSSAVLADVLAIARGEGSTWGSLPPALPAAELDDGASIPARWFCMTAAGPRLTERMSLAAAREQLHSGGAADDTTIYRVLEELA